MSTYNIYETKTNLSKLLAMVEKGESFIIANAGRPVADVTKHKNKKKSVRFGAWANYDDKTFYCPDEALVGIDPDIQEMFYGKDWDK